MTLVLDASAVVDPLIRSDEGASVRTLLSGDDEPHLVTVAHLDAEVMSALARLHRAGVLADAEVATLLQRLGSLAMRRLPITSSLLSAGWDVRADVADVTASTSPQHAAWVRHS